MPKARLAWLVLCLFALIGCVRRNDVGDVSTYSAAYWVLAATMSFGVALFFAGFWLLRAASPEGGQGRGYALMLLGIVAGVFLTWFVQRDSGLIDAKHFDLHAGSGHNSIVFDELKSVVSRQTEVIDSKGKPFTRYELICELRSGATRVVNVTGEIGKAMLPQLIEVCQQRNIPFDDSELPPRD